MPISSLEIEIHTAHIPRAGTDDAIYCSVHLSSGAALVVDHRLDDPRKADFKAGSRRTYALPLPTNLAQTASPDQIARITIRKDGDDGWALGGVALLANGVEVFRNASINQFLDSSDAVLGQGTWVSDRIVGPVLGGLGSDFARIQVRLESPGPVEARLTAPSGAAIAVPSVATPTAVIQLDGLAADTAYAYQIFRDGVPLANTEGRLRTLPAEDQGSAFSFAFGSCARNGSDPAQPCWDRVLDLADDLRFFLHLGDTFYFYDGDVLGHRSPDEARDPERAMGAANLSSRLHPGFLRMARRLPSIAVWDDHDFAGNNSIGAEFTNRAVARDTFLSYWANPDFGPAWRGFGLTTRLTVGRSDFYLLDGRFNRERFGDFFGRGQCDLVLGEIDARATTLGPRLVFLASGGPWHSMDQSDSYAERFFRAIQMHEEERTWFFGELADRVEDGRIRGLVLLAGDAHRAEIYQTVLTDSVVAPELVSSALGMPRRPTDSRPTTHERRFSRGVDADDGSFANFCVVTVDTSDAVPNGHWSLLVEFRRSDNGEVFFSKRYELADNRFTWS